MLEMLRNATGGWIAKIFIALLVASFAVWGITDIFVGGQGRALATVGKTEISAFEYQRVFREETRALSQRLGRNINQDQARALGLDRQVLNSLVGQAALNIHVFDLGLRISDKSIAATIADNPSFKDGRGNFSRSQFQAVLFQNGLTEQVYVENERSALLRGQIGRIIETGIEPPEFLLKTLYKYQSEQRQVSYFKVSAAAAGSITEPTDAELSGYYDQNKSSFKAPEYRKITVVSLQPEDVADTIEVSEEEIRQAYEERVDQFKRPERREILLISFPTTEEAEKARTGLTTFADYQALAQKRGLKDSDLTLGLVTETEISDPKLAQAAFELPAAKISDPVKGALSTSLIYVKKVEAGGISPFEDEREKLKSVIALERAQEEILNIHDALEDERAGGSTLDEIAVKMSLRAIKVDKIDATGNDENGIKITNLPASPDLQTQIFSAEVGDEVAPIETTEGGFIWLNIDEVFPTADRPLEQARADVVSSWKQNQRQKKLDAFITTLTERIKAGEDFTKIASEIGSTVKQSAKLKRFDSEDAVSPAAVTRIFLAAVDEVSSAPAATDDARVIFRLTDISAPAFDSASVDVKALQQQLTSSLGANLMRHYEVALRQNIDIDINQRVWSEVASGVSTGADPFHGQGPHVH